jgi:adenylate cyclase
MVQPVEILMSGVRSVEQGDLTIQIPINSSDEIGLLTGSFNKLVNDLRSKEQLKETFGKYIDPRIVEKVILNPGAAETEGGKRVMTISFCDLVGFTGISENLSPAGLVRLLNRHFELVADAIHAYQGVLDKFIGDAAMAFWGPPFSASGDHATQACRAALAQIRVLETLRLELPELTGLRKNIPILDLRIGVASGDVVVGNIGADKTRTYTVIGDTVNLASRLESVNRIYGTRILISAETRHLAAEAIEVREIDWIAVKGKTEPATAFELLGPLGEVKQERLEARDRYEEGLAAYRKFEWAPAEKALRGVLEIAPADGPAQLLLTRIAELRAAPPTREWDGVWHLTEK